MATESHSLLTLLLLYTAVPGLLRCEFRAVFNRLGSAVRAATLYDFDVALKREIL
jgi:hypothetical protein